MRYFVLTKDNSIIKAENVCKGPHDIIFSIGNEIYRFEYKTTGLGFPFEKLGPTAWYYTNEIKYLYELDEMEDEDLNYFQSTDFNAGIIYNQIEKEVVKEMIKRKGVISHSSNISIPIIQLLLKGSDSVAQKEIINTTHKAIIQHFNAVYGKNFTLTFGEYIKNNQYILFPYTISRKEEYREMTVAEIEKALGYKIKVVGEQ